MYPLSILTLLAALANDQRAARYFLPLPIVGAGLAIYHMLVERGVVGADGGLLDLGARAAARRSGSTSSAT